MSEHCWLSIFAIKSLLFHFLLKPFYFLCWYTICIILYYTCWINVELYFPYPQSIISLNHSCNLHLLLCTGFVLCCITNFWTNTSIPEINLHPQSEFRLHNRSINPNCLNHAQFTFSRHHIHNHNHCDLFERIRNPPFPAQYSKSNERQRKKGDPTKLILCGKRRQVQINRSTIIRTHFSWFVVSFETFCVFGLRRRPEESLTLHKAKIFHVSDNEKELRFEDLSVIYAYWQSQHQQLRTGEVVLTVVCKLWRGRVAPVHASCGEGESHQYTSTWSLYRMRNWSRWNASCIHECRPLLGYIETSIMRNTG